MILSLVLAFVAFVSFFVAISRGILDPFIVMVFKFYPFTHFPFFYKKMNENDQKLLSKNYRFYRELKPFYQRSFEKKVQRFIKKYDFIGRENFEITNEVKLLIAANFVQLTFGMRLLNFDRFKTIIIYPKVFFSQINNAYHIGEYNRMYKTIVFSWDDFLKGNEIENDNINLGLHEFGHAIISQTRLYHEKNYDYFLLNHYHQKIQKNIHNKAYIDKLYQSQFFRDYAFYNEMEFFSVVLEYFYESPKQFQQRFPDLFNDIKMMVSYRNWWFK